MSPEISVIIPVHNVAPYLPTCLDSVRMQTFGDFECILVENHSTDESPSIAKDYARQDTRFRYREIAGKGPGTARNAGMDAASGKFLYFLDGDDFIHPQSFELLRTALLDADADLAVAQAQEVLEETTPADVFFDASGSGEAPAVEFVLDEHPLDTYYRDHAFSRGMTWGAQHLRTMVWNKLYRSSLVSNIRFGPMLISEDMLFTTEVLSVARCAVSVNKTLYAYRRFAPDDGKTIIKPKATSVRHGFRSITERFTFAHIEGLIASLEALGKWERGRSLTPETRRRFHEHVAQHMGMALDWAARRSRDGREARAMLARAAPLIRKFEEECFPVRDHISRKHQVGCRLLLDWNCPSLAWAWIAGTATMRRLLRSASGR